MFAGSQAGRYQELPNLSGMARSSDLHSRHQQSTQESLFLQNSGGRNQS